MTREIAGGYRGVLAKSVSMKEAAIRLGLGYGAFLRHVADGNIPVVYFPGRKHGRVALDSIESLRHFLRPHGALTPRRRDTGWVYALRILDEGRQPVKIGITFDRTPHARIRQIEKALPYPIEIIGVKEVQDPLSVETNIHLRFQSERLRGEWFDVTPRDARILVIDFSLHEIPEEGMTEADLHRVAAIMDGARR